MSIMSYMSSNIPQQKHRSVRKKKYNILKQGTNIEYNWQWFYT